MKSARDGFGDLSFVNGGKRKDAKGKTMTRHQKNEADGVRGREDAIGSATARGGENRAGTRAVRTHRSSFELPRRS